MKQYSILFLMGICAVLTGCGNDKNVSDLVEPANQVMEMHMTNANDSNLELNINDYYIMTLEEVGVRGICSEKAEVNRTLSYQMVDVLAVVYAENDEKWALISFFNFDSADDNIGWVKVSQLAEYTQENYSLLRYPVTVTDNCVDLETGDKVERDWFAVDYHDDGAEVSKEGGQCHKVAASSIVYPPFEKENKRD